MSGIVSYGAYIPSHKIETGEIASVWGADGSAWAKNLNVYSNQSLDLMKMLSLLQ